MRDRPSAQPRCACRLSILADTRFGILTFRIIFSLLDATITAVANLPVAEANAHGPLSERSGSLPPLPYYVPQVSFCLPEWSNKLLPIAGGRSLHYLSTLCGSCLGEVEAARQYLHAPAAKLLVAATSSGRYPGADPCTTLVSVAAG